MIVTPDEMYALEEAAFAAGSTPESLMDQVGERIARHLLRRAGPNATVLVYAGKGNNAGDALVAAEQLHQLARSLENKNGSRLRLFLRVVADKRSLGPLAQKKLVAIPAAVPRLSADAVENLARDAAGDRLLVLDGLLGLGARGATLREPIRSAAREINRLRREHGARVLAIDTPTGIDTETGQPAADAVMADETLSVGFAKTGLLADAATNFVGQLHVIRLRELDAAADALADDVKKAATARGALTTSATLAGLLPPRAFDAHKGDFGRVGILAGSVGATGAAVMCSHAAVRAGAGLVTLFVQREVYPTVAAAAAPEVMVRPLDSPLDLLKSSDADDAPKFDVLAVGPGLGRAGDAAIRELIERWPGPMVVDADGLNALASGDDLGPLDRAAGVRLLTPHPGEMARLRKASGVKDGDDKKSKPTRAEISRLFTEPRRHVTLLLKGARTLVSQHGRAPAYNTTGNPGMATGGMGDVLTGICAALLGQGLAPFDAARLGAWVHGRAADFALRGRAEVRGGESEESLAATDLFAHLGAAFREIRRAS